jgi:hypothetical protein
MAFVIQKTGVKFHLYDDGYLYSIYDTEAEAEAQIAKLIEEERLSTAVSNAVDEMMDDLRDQFPEIERATLQLLVVENLS